MSSQSPQKTNTRVETALESVFHLGLFMSMFVFGITLIVAVLSDPNFSPFRYYISHLAQDPVTENVYHTGLFVVGFLLISFAFTVLYAQKEFLMFGLLVGFYLCLMALPVYPINEIIGHRTVVLLASLFFVSLIFVAAVKDGRKWFRIYSAFTVIAFAILGPIAYDYGHLAEWVLAVIFGLWASIWNFTKINFSPLGL